MTKRNLWFNDLILVVLIETTYNTSNAWFGFIDSVCCWWCHQQRTCQHQRTMRERRWQGKGRLTHHHWLNRHERLWKQRAWWKSLARVLNVWGNRRQKPNHTLTRRKYSILLPPHHSIRMVQGSVQLCQQSVITCQIRGSQMSNRTRDVKPRKGGRSLCFLLLEIIMLNFSSSYNLLFVILICVQSSCLLLN